MKKVLWISVTMMAIVFLSQFLERAKNPQKWVKSPVSSPDSTSYDTQEKTKVSFEKIMKELKPLPPTRVFNKPLPKRDYPSVWPKKMELSDIIVMGFTIHRLPKLRDRIKESTSTPIDEPKRALWDINVLPKNAEEYQLYIEEHSYMARKQLVEAALSDNAVELYKGAGRLMATEFLKSLKILGQDENGKLVYDLPGDAFATLIKTGTRLPANSWAERADLFSLDPEKDMEQSYEAFAEAIEEIKFNQTKYDEEIAGQKDSLLNRPAGATFIRLLGILMKSFAAIPIFWGFTPESLHADNRDVAEDLVESIKEDPAAYGFTAGRSKKSRYYCRRSL